MSVLSFSYINCKSALWNERISEQHIFVYLYNTFFIFSLNKKSAIKFSESEQMLVIWLCFPPILCNISRDLLHPFTCSPIPILIYKKKRLQETIHKFLTRDCDSKVSPKRKSRNCITVWWHVWLKLCWQRSKCMTCAAWIFYNFGNEMSGSGYKMLLVN